MNHFHSSVRTARWLLAASAFLLLPSARASATTIIFDICEPASQCLATSQVIMRTELLDGNLEVTIGGNPREYGAAAFGFNVVDGLDLTISRISPNYSLAASAEIGPFGEFDIVFDAPPLGDLAGRFGWGFRISTPGGFTTGMELFDLNDAGFFAAAQVYRDRPGGQRDLFFTASDEVTLVPRPVPEPATLLLMGTGLAAAWRAKRRHTSC